MIGRERPLGLDMPFDEALKRFLSTDPGELNRKLEEAKKGEPPERLPGVDDKDEPVAG